MQADPQSEEAEIAARLQGRRKVAAEEEAPDAPEAAPAPEPGLTRQLMFHSHLIL